MLRPTRASAQAATILLAAACAQGCATSPDDQGTYDPLQDTNRSTEHFNDKLDRKVFKPVADAYVEHTPEPVRKGVTSFFNNVGYINVVLNDFLQGKFKQGAYDASRFVVNTTLGLAGIFDPATRLGLAAHDEDFGQTLGVWGSSAGAYLVIPVIGPSSVRDSPGLAMKAVTNLLFLVSNLTITAPLTLLGGIDKRAQADTAITFRNEVALDPYIFTREAYLQNRTFLIHDGNPPIDDSLFEDPEALGGSALPSYQSVAARETGGHSPFGASGWGLRPMH